MLQDSNKRSIQTTACQTEWQSCGYIMCVSVCVCIYISTSGSAAVTGPRQAQIIGSRLVNIAAFSTDDNTPLSDTHTHTHSMVHHTGPQLMPISVTNNHSDNIPRLPKK